MNPIEHLANRLNVLNVPRLEDLPYWSSPPIQFVYESTAALNLGTYIWNDVASVLTPLRPLIDNALYFFRTVTIAADISELDYTTNLVTTPAFYTFRASDSKTVLFREPITAPMFLNQMIYKFTWQSQRGADELFAAFRGTIVQGANLIGKDDITLKAVISAQEITEEGYVNLFRSKYPAGKDF